MSFVNKDSMTCVLEREVASCRKPIAWHGSLESIQQECPSPEGNQLVDAGSRETKRGYCCHS